MTGHPNGIYDPEATYATATSWGFSYNVQTYIPGYTKPKDQIPATATLNVIRYNGRGVDRHPEHDGKVFPNSDAAHQYALDQGLIAVHHVRTPA